MPLPSFGEWEESKHPRGHGGKFTTGGGGDEPSGKKDKDKSKPAAPPQPPTGKPGGVKPGAQATTGAQARKKEAKLAAANNGHPHANLPPHEQKSVVQKLAAVGAKVLATGKSAAGAVWSRLPEKGRAFLVGAFHVLEYTFIKANQFCNEIAKERGLPEGAAQRAMKYVAYADQALAYSTMYAIHGIAHEAHLDEMTSLVVAKAAAFSPIATMLYAAYSTVRNPLAVVRAAANMIRGTAAPVTHHAEGDLAGKVDIRKWAGDVMEWLSKSKDPDWAEALLAAALDHAKHPAKALALAQEAARKPRPKA